MCKPLEGHTPRTALRSMELEGARNSLRKSRPAVIPPTTCAATTSAASISALGTAVPALGRAYDVRRSPGKKWSSRLGVGPKGRLCSREVCAGAKLDGKTSRAGWGAGELVIASVAAA